MGWRTIYISESSKLSYRLNSLGVMQKDEIIWVNLNEIDIIIIEDLLSAITLKLLSELSKKGIVLVVCDEKHMPISILQALLNNQRTAKYNKLQLEWNKNTKRNVWTKIVKHKILLQLLVLIKLNKTEKVELMANYIENVELGDISNREGLAAKVYFHELFGSDFNRKREAEDVINSALNYIYQVIRAKIAQEIIAHGYIPSLGIYHCSEYNYFGLADDIIEVFRPIADLFIINIIEKEEITFMTSTLKEKILNILYELIKYKNSKQKFIEVIRLYTIEIIDCLTLNAFDNINFPYFLDE